jgi:subtilisin family serine protease
MKLVLEVDVPGSLVVMAGHRGARSGRARLIAESALQKVNAKGEIDKTFEPTPIRVRPYSGLTKRVTQTIDVAVLGRQPRRIVDPREQSWLVRTEVEDPAEAAYRLSESASVVAAWSDLPVSRVVGISSDDPPRGNASKVAELLGVGDLHASGMDGGGVNVAVVDTGFSHARVAGKGRTNPFVSSPGRPCVDGGDLPGQHDHEDHGAMCAWNVGIAAPKATLLDFGVLCCPGQTEVFLSDLATCYMDIRDFARSSKHPLVVTNSWEVLDPGDDLPEGDPGRYYDNPGHYINLLADELETVGVDMVFAAGNCGPGGDSQRCSSLTGWPTIGGLNSHRSVLTVGAADVVDREPADFSSVGPGAIEPQKPDVLGYSHYSGFLDPGPDSGTSTAAPLVAGVLAAVRTKWPPGQVPPPALRELVRQTATKISASRPDYSAGWGIIDPPGLIASLGSAFPLP